MMKILITCLVLTIFLGACRQETKSKTSNNKPEETEAEDVVAEISDITCPKCGFTTTEELPTEYCLIRYECKNCGAVIHPKEGDCCVFCSYGTHKCPSKQ